MKCRAKDQIREEKITAMTTLFGTKCLEAVQQKAALLLLENFPWFRRGSGPESPWADRLRLFFDGQAEAVETEMNENAAENVWIRDRRGRHQADRAERFEEIVNDADYRLTRQLRDGGIDAEKIYSLAEAGVPDKMFVGTDALHFEARVCWYEWLGRRAVRTWLAGAGLSLLSFRLPSGRRRFPIRAVEEDFLAPLSEFVSRWLTAFFGGQDRTRETEAAERARILMERYNVDLAPVREQDELLRTGADRSAVIRREPPERERPPVPAEYEKILAETQAGRGFGTVLTRR